MSTLDQHLHDWSARVLGKASEFDVGRIDPLWTQRYALSVDDRDPVYFDDDFARSVGLRGMIAPPNYLATLRSSQVAGPADDALLADGTLPDGRPDVPGLQIMGGGQKIDFHDHVYCGETIRARKQIVSIQKKEGRNGTLVIVEEEIVYENTQGERKMTLVSRALYRLVDEVAHG